MPHIRTAAVAALVVAGGLVALSDNVTAASGGQRATEETLRVVNVITTIKTLDLGPDGASPGDVILFRDRVWNRNKTKRIGFDVGQCTLNARLFGNSCEWTFRMRGRGKLMVQGAAWGGSPDKFAITGGTGDFRDAGGVVVLREPGGTQPQVGIYRVLHTS